MLVGQAMKLGNISTLYDSLHKTPKDYVDSGFPMIRVTDVKRGFVNFEGTKKVSRDVYEEFSKKYKPSVGDVIFTRVGSYGNSCYVDKNNEFCLGQNTVCISPNEAVIEPYYLYTFLNSPIAKTQIDSFISGSSQPTISLKSIKEIEINLPEMKSQKSIANFFGAYDNLIENNSHRIAILEDMAQSLYREWFVKFRYPGHESQTLVDSPLGAIPEGWEVKKLSDIAKVNPEGITKKNAPESIRYIDIKSVSTGSINETKEMLFAEAPSRARRKVQHGDVIWATVRPNRKQYSFIAKPKDNTVVSTGFAVLRANNVSPAYLYFAVTTDDFSSYLVNHATGSAYPAVNAKDFENALVLKPDNATLTKFDSLVSPCVDQIEVLKNKNVNLKQQRDLLLPKLISGKLKL